MKIFLNRKKVHQEVHEKIEIFLLNLYQNLIDNDYYLCYLLGNVLYTINTAVKKDDFFHYIMIKVLSHPKDFGQITKYEINQTGGFI